LKPARGLGSAEPGRRTVSVHYEVKTRPRSLMSGVKELYRDDDIRQYNVNVINEQFRNNFSAKLVIDQNCGVSETPNLNFWGVRTHTIPQWLRQ